MKRASSKTSEKNLALEALRGMAAIVVLVWHTMLAFTPQYMGIFPQYESSSWQGSPFFVFIYGIGAVSLFFVLSGYILTRQYFETGDNGAILRSVVKRLPRLMGPVLVTVLFSWLFFELDFYDFERAGLQSGSPWLVKFGYAFDQPFKATFRKALLQGSFFTFFRGDSSYDGSIWTMRPEFIGSFIAFGMAPILWEARRSRRAVIALIVGSIVVICHFSLPGLSAFPLGVALAALLPPRLAIARTTGATLLILALYLIGYSGSAAGAYGIFAWYPPDPSFSFYPAISGALIVIFVFEACPPIKRNLSGIISKWLGEFSFPIYLVHMLVISSVGARVYLAHGVFAAMASVMACTVAGAYPLLLFNRAWVSAVNRWADWIMKPAYAGIGQPGQSEKAS